MRLSYNNELVVFFLHSYIEAGIRFVFFVCFCFPKKSDARFECVSIMEGIRMPSWRRR
jgi:hypothetical protein